MITYLKKLKISKGNGHRDDCIEICPINYTCIDIHSISFHVLKRQQFEKLFSTKAYYPKVA